MNVDIVLPVYNEKGNVRSLVDEIDQVLSEQDYDYNLILVDDGSSDGSSEIIRELAADRDSIRSVHFRENCGQSAAFKAGFEHATSELVVTLDADGQNDPSEIPEMVELADQYDVVAGYRANRQDHWIRSIGSSLANKVRNWVTGDNVIDTGCSLKVFHREVIQEIPMFKGMHRFLPTLAKMEGFSVTQHPTNHRERKEGETKYSLSGRLFETIWDLLAVRWMQKRHLDYEIEEKNN